MKYTFVNICLLSTTFLSQSWSVDQISRDESQRNILISQQDRDYAFSLLNDFKKDMDVIKSENKFLFDAIYAYLKEKLEIERHIQIDKKRNKENKNPNLENKIQINQSQLNQLKLKFQDFVAQNSQLLAEIKDKYRSLLQNCANSQVQDKELEFANTLLSLLSEQSHEITKTTVSTEHKAQPLTEFHLFENLPDDLRKFIIVKAHNYQKLEDFNYKFYGIYRTPWRKDSLGNVEKINMRFVSKFCYNSMNAEFSMNWHFAGLKINSPNTASTINIQGLNDKFEKYHKNNNLNLISCLLPEPEIVPNNYTDQIKIYEKAGLSALNAQQKVEADFLARKTKEYHTFFDFLQNHTPLQELSLYIEQASLLMTHSLLSRLTSLGLMRIFCSDESFFPILQNLTNLKKLQLDTFIEIPGESIRGMTQIESLSFYCANSIRQDITITVDDLVALTKLKKLDILNHVHIRSLDLTQFSQLTNLESLTLRNNDSTYDSRINDEFLFSLTQLKELNIEIPYHISAISLSKMTNLKKLHLSEHYKTNVTNGIIQLTQLEYLSFFANLNDNSSVMETGCLSHLKKHNPRMMILWSSGKGCNNEWILPEDPTEDSNPE